jgi:hypothetical protein
MSSQASSSSAAAIASPAVKEDPRMRTKARDIIIQERYVKYLTDLLAEVRARFDGAVDAQSDRARDMAAAINTAAGAYLAQSTAGRSDAERAATGSVIATAIANGGEALIAGNQTMENHFYALGAIRRRLERARAKLERLVEKRRNERALRRAELLEDFARRHANLVDAQLELAMAKEREERSRARIDKTVGDAQRVTDRLRKWNRVKSEARGLSTQGALGLVRIESMDYSVKMRLDGYARAEESRLNYREAVMSAESSLRVAHDDAEQWRKQMRESMAHERQGGDLYQSARRARSMHIVQLEIHAREINALAVEVQRAKVSARVVMSMADVGTSVQTAVVAELDEALDELRLALDIAAGHRVEGLRVLPGVSAGAAQVRERAYAIAVGKARATLEKLRRYAQRRLR